MNLNDTDFELFGVPATFAQDRRALDARWKELQREAHPDRYQRLKDPVRRAAYLCELHGAEVDAERNTAMPTDFLMQQMEWREALDDATTPESVERLHDEVEAGRARALSSLDRLIDEQGDHPAAAQQVRALMFIERFAHDVENRADRLGQ